MALIALAIPALRTLSSGERSVPVAQVRIATVDSPEPRNEFAKEKAALENQEATLSRESIEIRRKSLANRQTAAVADIHLQAAEREFRRAEGAYGQHVISRRDFEKARNDLAAARINDKHAIELKGREASGGTEIVVLDRGSGMSGKVLEQALLPFYSSKANGTGLGLTLSRELIEAHSARLLLAPRADGGTSASVRLPAAPIGVI